MGLEVFGVFVINSIETNFIIRGCIIDLGLGMDNGIVMVGSGLKMGVDGCSMGVLLGYGGEE